MAKGESGAQTAIRYRELLEKYIHETPIENVPLYAGRPSRMAISAAIGIDRKRLESPQCQPLFLELERNVQEFLKQSPPVNDAIGSSNRQERRGCPEDFKDSDQLALERQVEKYRSEVKKLESKINLLTQRVAVQAIELEHERRKKSGIVEHFETSIRTLHVN
jgi:hypothetical protein